MNFPISMKAAENMPALSAEPSEKSSPAPSSLRPLFVGPNGLRAGWRMLIFLAMIAAQVGILFMIARAHGGNARPVAITPLLLGPNEAVLLLIVCLATWIMSRIEHRAFRDYGLPIRSAFRKDFWVGCLCGFSAISGTLLTMFLLGAFRITGLATRGTAIFSSLFAWGGTFLLVGFFEESSCRGYLQYTLASGIGFWPAAFVMSALFALGHASNPHESVIGVAEVALFGLLLCLFLRRTGNLWCAVGFHFAYDWGQTFFYGVPDSGIVPNHNLFQSAFSGPRWLTGGTVGPEASLLTPIALLLVALVFSRYYRENRYRELKPRALPVTVS